MTICTFGVILGLCVHMAPMNVCSNALVSFLDLRFDRKRQPQHDEALRGIQPVEDPTAEPPPSEKDYKRAVLSIIGLQMISRDTPFLRCQAGQLYVLLDSDFE